MLESEETPGGGSGVILGPVIGTGGTGTSTGGGGPTVGGGDTTGGGGGRRRRWRHDGGGDDVIALGPGDGREWGQSHKLTKGEGGLPPWATANGHADDNADQVNGHGDVPPGHDPDHGNGHGKEHARGHATATAGTGNGYSSTRYRIVGRISQSTCSLVTVPSCTHPAVS